MNRDAIEKVYQVHCESGTAMAAHLPVLRSLAAGCSSAVEFGVKRGGSSSALLLGCGKVTSFDIVLNKRAVELKRLAGDAWDYRIESSLTAEPVGADLLFIDSLHTYSQMAIEISRHGPYAHKYIAFHDTITFGSVGAAGETGKHEPDVLGIRPAIDEFMVRYPHWKIAAHHVNSHGLLILERGDR